MPGPLSTLLVLVGGIAGTAARYGLARALPEPAGGFPAVTLLINVSGAFLLGLLVADLAHRGPDTGRRHAGRLLFGTGVLGAYTTYSTFALDAVQLARHHRLGLAALYVAASLAGGMVAAATGITLAGGPAGVAVDPDPDDES